MREEFFDGGDTNGGLDTPMGDTHTGGKHAPVPETARGFEPSNGLASVPKKIRPGFVPIARGGAFAAVEEM